MKEIRIRAVGEPECPAEAIKATTDNVSLFFVGPRSIFNFERFITLIE